MITTWVLAADGTRARIFRLESVRGPLHEIETLTNPEGRLHEQQLTSDLPGRTFDRSGPGRHVLESKIGPKRQTVISFVNRIAERLDKGRVEGNFARLVIIAAPGLLGMLRGKLSAKTSERVVLEIDKAVAHQSVEAILRHLPERLPGELV